MKIFKLAFLAFVSVVAFICINILGFFVAGKFHPPTRINDWFLMMSALGEFVIAFVIYWEWEGNRLDQFLHDADNRNRFRKQIFKTYCGLNPDEKKPRNEMFRELLGKQANECLKDLCEENVRLLSRVGARLPIFPPLRNRALDWHVVVLLWEILGPYVKERRADAGTSYATPFLKYALESVERLLKQDRKWWKIVDPDVDRKNDVTLTRENFEQMRDDLKTYLARSQATG